MPAAPLPETPVAADLRDARLKAANRRMALVLASIALLFFVGIIATRYIGDATTGIGVLGGAVLLFLVIAIGRNLHDKR
jgi:hypothetical protein